MTSYKFQLILPPPLPRNIELYCNHMNTRQVWYSNGSFVSGCQNGPMFEWWSENRTEKSRIKVLNVRYLNVLPGCVT